MEKLGSTTLLERRMRDDLTETFKIINGISNYGRHFFNISPQTWNLLSRQISKAKSISRLDIFANRVMFLEQICLIRSKTAIMWKKKLRLKWMISELMVWFGLV